MEILKQKMISSENLLRTVRFEKPDYIPMTFHINSSCWNYYRKQDIMELVESHPFLFKNPEKIYPSKETVYPPHVRAGKPFVDPWGCVCETKENGMVGIITQHPLASWDKLANYKAPDADKSTHWGPIDWLEAAKCPQESVYQLPMRSCEIGHNHTWLRLIDIRGYENVTFDMEDNEPRLFKIIEMLENFNTKLLDNYINIVGAKWISFAEDLGMQNGPMLKPQHFQKYIKPSYLRLTKKAHQAGCIVQVHSDGDLRSLMGDLLDCPIDVMNLQDLVNGIEWIRNNLTGKICVMLDIDRQQITHHGSPKQIDELIRNEVERLGSKQGGLMMIYGLYPGVPLENARAVMDAMEKYMVL